MFASPWAEYTCVCRISVYEYLTTVRLRPCDSRRCLANFVWNSWDGMVPYYFIITKIVLHERSTFGGSVGITKYIGCLKPYIMANKPVSWSRVKLKVYCPWYYRVVLLVVTRANFFVRGTTSRTWSWSMDISITRSPTSSFTGIFYCPWFYQ